MDESTPAPSLEARYEALKAKYHALELRVTRFSAVQQQLIDTKDRLDREVTIYSRMHRFNSNALQDLSPQAFAELVAEALVDVFEVEIGCVWTWDHTAGASCIAATHGVKPFNSSLADLPLTLHHVTPGKSLEWTSILTEAQRAALAPALTLRHAIVSQIADEHAGPKLLLLAGNSEDRYRLYEPISKDREQVFAVFAQQVIAHLSNLQNRRTIRRTVNELRDSEEKLRRIGDNLPNGMVFQVQIDDTGQRTFLYVSEGVERIHNLSSSDVLAHSDLLYNQILPEDLMLLNRKERDSIAFNKPYAVEIRIRNTRGELRWVYLSCAPTRQPGSKIRWDGLELDITERRRLEERLQQSQKMEGIGHLAGGVAHEFNNLLAAMLMNLNLARLDGGGTTDVSILNDLEALCKRAASLVKQLLAFSRQSILRMQPLELDAVISEECRLLGRLLGEQISLEFSTVPNLPLVQADKGMIGQVLLNLALNARDAMPNGGTLRLRLSILDLTNPLEGESLDLPQGHYVCLTVADTGCGMDAHTQQHIFEPFYTTKPVGKGTGLGLATVRGIIQQHRGTLSVESELGKGTLFRIYLPAISSTTDGQRRSDAETNAIQLATILLVEDEIGIRKATARFLHRMGYYILEAGTATEGLAIWMEHHQSIDMLFTDMVMPGEMTGLQLAERLVIQKPKLKVILTSGYHTDVLDACKSSKVALTFLAKPSMPEEISSAITRCLQSA